MQNKRILTQEEFKERAEHRDTLVNIQAVLSTKPGKDFVKYLFKNFDVGEVPEIGLVGDLLMDKIGSMRAGNALFKIVSEANFEIAGQLLAQIEKEKYEEILRDTMSGN